MSRAEWDYLAEAHVPRLKADGTPGSHCESCSLRWPCDTADMLREWAEERDAAEAEAARLRGVQQRLDATELEASGLRLHVRALTAVVSNMGQFVHTLSGHAGQQFTECPTEACRMWANLLEVPA